MRRICSLRFGHVGFYCSHGQYKVDHRLQAETHNVDDHHENRRSRGSQSGPGPALHQCIRQTDPQTTEHGGHHVGAVAGDTLAFSPKITGATSSEGNLFPGQGA